MILRKNNLYKFYIKNPIAKPNNKQWLKITLTKNEVNKNCIKLYLKLKFYVNFTIALNDIIYLFLYGDK